MYIPGYFLTLGVFDTVEIYGDVKAAASLVFGPYHHAPALNVIGFPGNPAGDGQNKPHCDLGKGRNIFIYMAIRAHAADVLGRSLQIIAVGNDIQR
jgi:hypothetical protein